MATLQVEEMDPMEARTVRPVASHTAEIPRGRSRTVGTRLTHQAG